MKKYEFVKIHLARFYGAKGDSHRGAIERYAERGFRYIGYIPINFSDYGKIADIDLVFEKEIGDAPDVDEAAAADAADALSGADEDDAELE